MVEHRIVRPGGTAGDGWQFRQQRDGARCGAVGRFRQRDRLALADGAVRQKVPFATIGRGRQNHFHRLMAAMEQQGDPIQ